MASDRHKEIYSHANYFADLDDEKTLPDKKFNCIIATQVLMYMNNPEQGLKSLKQMLYPNGVLILTIPGPIFHHSKNSHHMFSFTEESIKYLCENTFGEFYDFKYYGSIENAENMFFWTKYNPNMNLDNEKEYLYTMIMGIRTVNKD